MSPKNIYLTLVSIFVLSVTGTVNPQDQFHRPCISRDFGRGSIVCVCNSTYCDSAPVLLTPTAFPTTFASDEQLNRGLIQIYTSTKTGQRLHKSTLSFNNEFDREQTFQQTPFSPGLKQSGFLFPGKIYGNDLNSRKRKRRVSALSEQFFDLLEINGNPNWNKISKLQIRRSAKYQEILGFGGAFTDATGINLKTLSYETQLNLMKSYFGEDGNEYSMGRVPIAGTDFSRRSYTYDDTPFSDTNLTHFSLQPEDYKFKIPLIQWAQKLSKTELKLVGSPWTAPAWMKTNGKLTGAGVLRKEFYQAWADYIIKFLKAYKEYGVSFWGITPQNEPSLGLVPTFPFNCMGWSPSTMKVWISKYLGPTLKNTDVVKDVNIIILDDSKFLLESWAKLILGDRDASQYVHGVGTHWYFDFLTSQDVLSRFHKTYPNYYIIQTEASMGFAPWELEKVILGSWSRLEHYSENIINDLKNWVGGWLDWNLALDLDGNPNWAGWRADSAILVNAKNDEFYKQPIYYGIGHFSKFVPPGSVRIDMSETSVPRNLKSVAFLRPDNGTVVIILNKSAYEAKVSLYDEERGSLFLNIPGKSIQSFVYW